MYTATETDYLFSICIRDGHYHHQTMKLRNSYPAKDDIFILKHAFKKTPRKAGGEEVQAEPMDGYVRRTLDFFL